MTGTQQEHDDLDNRLGFHPATRATGRLHDAVRGEALAFGHWLLDNVPAGRHRELALTAVQEAMMWANAAVACDTPPEQPAEPATTAGEQLRAE